MSMGRPVTPGPEGGEGGKATFAMVTVLLGKTPYTLQLKTLKRNINKVGLLSCRVP
jgi:hypothetical protein